MGNHKNKRLHIKFFKNIENKLTTFQVSKQAFTI